MVLKNFSPKVFPLSRQLDKRWFVKYSVPNANGYGYKNLKLYGNINTFETAHERMKAGKALVKLLAKNQYNIIEDSTEKIHPLIELCATLHLRDSSKRAYVSKVAYFIQWLKRDKLTEFTGIQFLDHLKSKGKSPATINAYRQTVKRVFKLAIKQKIYNIKDPFDLTSKIKHRPTGKMFFTEQQQAALKKELIQEPQLWLGVQMQYYCFTRNGPEMSNLLIADIDFTPGSEKILMRGEIAKNKQTQYVAIPSSFLPSLLFLKNYPGNYYVFSKDEKPGTSPVSCKWFYNHHKPIEKRLGLVGKRFSFYSWKHTGIYMFIKSGGNLKQLQIQLRHHSLDQVNQYIRDFGLEDCGDIKNKFPAL